MKTKNTWNEYINFLILNVLCNSFRKKREPVTNVEEGQDLEQDEQEPENDQDQHQQDFEARGISNGSAMLKKKQKIF